MECDIFPFNALTLLVGQSVALLFQVIPTDFAVWCGNPVPRAGSGVVRIDPQRFLARCHTRRLNQAPSVLSISLGLF